MDVSVMQRRKVAVVSVVFNANVPAVTASVYLFYSAVVSVKDMIAGNDDDWDDVAEDEK